jgi:hypothetical protein
MAEHAGLVRGELGSPSACPIALEQLGKLTIKLLFAFRAPAMELGEHLVERRAVQDLEQQGGQRRRVPLR